MNIRYWIFMTWTNVLVVTFLNGNLEAADDRIDFDRQIRPILSQHCFHCHGPDAKHRESGLRFDDMKSATSELESGETAIVPGKPDESALVARIISADKDEVMPPPEANRDLDDSQKKLLRQWISEGATFKEHWAFAAPKQSAPPKVNRKDWPRNPIDYFVLARLEAEKLAPSPEAAKETLIRRLSLDLNGLPPTPKEIDAFLSDKSPDSYEKVVDRLLASPRYGERMAWPWLDAARYADTAGYQADPTRPQWPWRDWVVKALNENMPFDQFTTEQIAGDRLPNATLEQQIATAFNRNHMHNGEGGRIAEETRVEIVFDRAETTATTWLGLTFQCARCHDHKFDPISIDEYYAFYDFFNQTSDNGGGGRQTGAVGPSVVYVSPDVQQRLDDLAAQVAAMHTNAMEDDRSLDAAQLQWERAFLTREATRWTVLEPTTSTATGNAVLTTQPDRSILASGPNPPKTTYTITAPVKRKGLLALRVEALVDHQHPAKSNGRAPNGNAFLSEIEASVRPLNNLQGAPVPVKFASAQSDHEPASAAIDRKLDENGWSTLGQLLKERRVAIFVTDGAISIAGGYELTVRLRFESKYAQHTMARFRLAVSDDPELAQTGAKAVKIEMLPGNLGHTIIKTPSKRSKKESLALREHYRRHINPDGMSRFKELGRLTAQHEALKKQAAKLRVMTMDHPKSRRNTFVLVKGIYNKKTDRKVTAGVPAALPPLPKDGNVDRLALAQWLTSGEHPLTARVAVNRYWQTLFGRGIVTTPGDFGHQGAPPTHPELLDWLAVEFIRSGWDVKHMHKLMVTSATYRQSSRVTPLLIDRDPENVLLARSPRFRMPSWMLRDQALSASGLLVPTVGGPPVKPYQPAGVWAEATFGKIRYQRDKGDALYRRSLYTFWRRIIGPTMFFDVAKRQTCEVKPNLTNTPLHALTTFNETGYVEAARALAELSIKTGGHSAESRIAMAFRQLTARLPTAEETAVLVHRLGKLRQHYAADTAARSELLGVGQSKADPKVDATEHAAMSALCNLMMNLDEVLNRP